MNGRRDVVDLRGVERNVGAQLAGLVERFVADVDGNGPCAERAGDHHRRESYAAATMHGHPLSGLGSTLLGDGTVGGSQAAAEAGGCDARHLVGQRNEIRVGVPHRHQFGVGSPASEARLVLPPADLMIAHVALRTMSTAGDERNCHPAAEPTGVDLVAGGHHFASQFMPRHVRHGANIGVVPSPAVPVAAAQPGRGDANHCAVGRRLGIGDRLHGNRSAKFVIDNGFHMMLFHKHDAQASELRVTRSPP